MNVDVFLEFVRQNGFAGGCLAVLAIAIWRSSVWFAREIAKPLFDRLMRFIDVAELVLCRQADDITAIRQKIDRMEVKQEEHIQICSQALSSHP